jgi:hypothetical protein
MKTYTFKITHDNGSFKLSAEANDLQTAENMICKSENCPVAALKLIKEVEILYKVLRVFRRSQRRQVIERYLTEADAKRLVNQFPDSNTSMVIFTRH